MTTQKYNTLTFSINSEKRIGTLTINRPQSLNALNREVLSELDLFLDDVSSFSFGELACLILTGAGEKAFVAGADIKEMSPLKELEAQDFSKLGHRVCLKIEALKIPVIAMVSGFALGGGCELAMACDFIFASEKAKFGLPETSLGLVPGFGGTVRLSRLIGPARAKEALMTAEIFSAQEAFRMGLVNRIFAPEELLAATWKTAELISTRGPHAIARGKLLIHEGFELSKEAACELEAKAFGKSFNQPESIEGMNAFMEKRKPNFIKV